MIWVSEWDCSDCPSGHPYDNSAHWRVPGVNEDTTYNEIRKGSSRMAGKKTKFTERSLCSVWDLVHHTYFQAMTLKEVRERFGVSGETANRWLELARELGVEIAEVQTPQGVAYRTKNMMQGYDVVDEAMRHMKDEQRKKRNARQKKYRAVAK